MQRGEGKWLRSLILVQVRRCYLAALPSAGVTWETDDNGFVVSATGKEMKVEYRYDSEGYPLGK
ncbi:YnfC family lipoprotein, partial [Salmonella enterica subsp. enterica serovar Anatum]|nr:YnfC family lipoprotein [Salmonella enterica subsp. enterica serovar Anatum]